MLSLYDLKIHCLSLEETNALDLEALFSEVQESTLLLPKPSYDCIPANFWHLVSGYEAAYYAYAIAEPYAAHMHQKQFQADPLSTKAGAEYRQVVLETDTSYNPKNIFEKLLGGPLSLDAFYDLLSSSGFGVQAPPYRYGIPQETEQMIDSKASESKLRIGESEFGLFGRPPNDTDRASTKAAEQKQEVTGWTPV